MANADKNSEGITSEHAVVIPPVAGASSIMAYVEAVATVIGSCHIHSVYEDTDYIKMYLNDKKFVDFLVNTGISVIGRRVNVDYAIPRADKVILKNIDPIIPDNILMRFLCYYGTPVSTIIHEKIATNLEYSHIECGTRKIYMNLFKDKKPPTKVSIQYQEVSYRFEMSVERYDKSVMDVDSSTTEEVIDDETVLDETQEVESVETGKPNIHDLDISNASKKSRSSRGLKPPSPKQAAYRGRGRSRKNGENSTSYAARKIKSRAAKDWYKNKVTKVKTITSNKLFVKKGTASVRGKKGRGGFRGRGRGSQTKVQISAGTPTQEDSESNPSLEGQSIVDDVGDIGLVPPAGNASPNSNITQAISQYPLTTDELKKLMFQTRCHRAPLQVAEEFLVKNNAPNALEDLLKQLLEYHNSVKIQSLRIRIRRLVKSIESAAKEKTAS